ncbi:sex-regulated protein janus-A-like [Glossina fuscipes fuscipes]
MLKTVVRFLSRAKKRFALDSNAVPNVDIDEGSFKYVLIKVSDKENSDDSATYKTIVRGYKDCQGHSDIYERVKASCKVMGLKAEILGGGRIERDSLVKRIKVYGQSQIVQLFLRTFSRKIYISAYIYERVSASCAALGLATECLGGGRIEHNPSAKLIKVYGYSQGFGKADHSETKKILLTKYKDYTIEISDEGY